MDSSDGHSDVSDGSGSGRETRRTKGTDRSLDKGPRWSCIKETFQDWLWETEPVWDAMGLYKTYTGLNRDNAQSTDLRERPYGAPGAPERGSYGSGNTSVGQGYFPRRHLVLRGRLSWPWEPEGPSSR